MSMILKEQIGKVLLCQINRPEKLNALNREVLEELVAILGEARINSDIHVVVLTGTQKAFSVGADIEVFVNTPPEEFASKASDFHLWDAIRLFPKPLVAAVHGYVYGGGLELALCCDLIFASEDARFASPEIRIGLIPGAGATQLLSRRLGKYRALELILTGREFSAEEAWRWGLVNAVYPSEELLSRSMEVAEQIAARAMSALRAAKAAVNYGLSMPLDAAYRYERELFLWCLGTQESREILTKFITARQQRKGQKGG